MMVWIAVNNYKDLSFTQSFTEEAQRTIEIYSKTKNGCIKKYIHWDLYRIPVWPGRPGIPTVEM